jgi:P27 family predicted phage terminase small subunit
MAKPRVPDHLKKLRGTFERSRAAPPLNVGRVRLVEPIEPPSDLDKASQAEWRLHMQLCLGAGTLSVVDLRTFRVMCEAAAMTARCYREAQKAGPVTTDVKGNMKMSPELLAWKIAANVYTGLLVQFGLSPASAKSLPQLPPAQGTPLKAVSP